MFKKIIIPATFCVAFALVCTDSSLAQERTKTSLGKLLMQQPHSQRMTTKEIAETKKKRPRPLNNRRSPYRTIDGTNNNMDPRKRNWGAADIIFHREISAAYSTEDPNNAMNGQDRPSPREISNLVCKEPVKLFNTRQLSTLGFQWGQFLDHDITLTPEGHTEYAPILLPEDEALFTVPIPFFRSEFRTVNAQREQFNINTAFIDGSVVYGSDEERASWLRTGRHGKLKTSEGNLLPYNTVDGEITGELDPTAPSMADDEEGTNKTYVAGDVRANENVVLTAIHTLFVREHNRICDHLIKRGARNDEQIYQMARKEVGAIIQAITYNEYLPSLGIDMRPYRGYSDRVRPDLMNTFSTASFRIGHTQVSEDIIVVDNDCQKVGPGTFGLVETFFNPELFAAYSIENWIKGSTVHELRQTDSKINDILRDFLFGNIDDQVRAGIDLGSLNIQRGRDHGLPDYNTARAFYTGAKARDFSDISSDETVASNLESLYGSVDNIDLWVGILSEDFPADKSVGNTMNAMLATQFSNLRDGDFYYYLNDPYLPREVKKKIHRTTFSELISRNTTLTSLSHNVFFTDYCLPENGKIASAAKISNAFAEDVEKVYPNPVENTLHLDFVDEVESRIIHIYAANGKLVETIDGSGILNQIQINTTHLRPGIYTLSIVTEKGTKSLRFSKL